MIITRSILVVLIGMVVLTMASVVIAETQHVVQQPNRMEVSRNAGQSSYKTEMLHGGGTLTLLRGECVRLKAVDMRGQPISFTLESDQGRFRIATKKLHSDNYELCGQHISYTEPETKVRVVLGRPVESGQGGKVTGTDFTVVVASEPIDIDFARAGESMVSLYWGILFRNPEDPNQTGTEAFNYARGIEKEDMPGFIRTAEQIAGSDEFRQNIFSKYSAEDIVDNFYCRFLAQNNPPHNAEFKRMVELVKQGKASLVVADIVTTKEFLDRIRQNKFYRCEDKIRK